MADFDVNTITVQGAVAIASATAGDKLVIDGCDATTDVLTQAQAVQIATRPASPASTTDTIGLAGSTDNHVYAYASFIRGESTGGDVHSFLLYGHMESDATNVFVVAVASATAPTHIPTSSDVTNRVEIQFELTFSATDEVVTVTDTSMYTTRGEFLILKNRTVTTHAEGQATVGEDQTVYGKKEFMDDMIFNGMYQVQAKTLEGQNTQNMFAFTQNGERQNVGPTITAMTTYNGTSYVSSTASIGATAMLGLAGGASFSAEHKAVGDSNAAMEATRGLGGAYAGVVVEPTQVTLYTQAASGGARKTVVFNGSALEVGANVYAPSMVAEKFELLNASASMEWDAQSSTIYFSQPITVSSFKQEDGNVEIDDAGVYTDNLNPMSGSKIEANGSIVPGTSNTYNLGDAEHRWRYVYVNNVDTSYIRTKSAELDIDCEGSTTGYFSEIYLFCDDPTYPGARIALKPQSGSESQYHFYPDGFYAPGKDLGYSGGGEWQYLYCGEVVTALVSSPSRTCTLQASQSMIGEAKFICDLDSTPVQARIHVSDADSGGEDATFYFDYAKFYAISSFDNVDLGTSDHEFGTVYARDLRGRIPTVSGTTEPEVGAIFFAGIEVAGALNAGIGRTAKVGSPLIPGGNNVTAIGPASWDTQTGFSSYTPFSTTAGIYKLLCGATKTGSEAACFALVMRIE